MLCSPRSTLTKEEVAHLFWQDSKRQKRFKKVKKLSFDLLAILIGIMAGQGFLWVLH